MDVCAAFDPHGPYIIEMVRFVDCQALALGQDGWAALGPSSTWGLALSGLMTVLLALVGYRLLLGGHARLGDGVSIAVRLGIVLALSTQWGAWQTMVRDVAIGGPQELASAILGPSGLGGERVDGLVECAQQVSDALNVLATAAPGNQGAAPNEATPTQTRSPGARTGASDQALADAARGSGVSASGLGLSPETRKGLASSGRLFTLTALGGLLSMRLAVALLLALGPVFVAFLLFETTRGLFASWACGLAGVAMGVVVVAAVLAFELAVLVPEVVDVRAQLQAEQLADASAGHIWQTTAVFAVMMMVALVMVVRAASGLKLPAVLMLSAVRGSVPGAVRDSTRSDQPGRAMAPNPATVGAGHAQRVVDAAMAMERRDAADRPAQARAVSASMGGTSPHDRLPALPLGQAGRRNRVRLSASATRRDATR